MILEKLLFIASATILPLPIMGARARGRSGGLSLSLPKPVENLGPFPDTASEDSPRLDLPLATSHLRLVSDASANVSEPVPDVSDRSKIKEAAVLAFDRRKEASTGKFVRWLSENYGGQDLTLTRLLGHYFEFCELFDRRPLRERQLLNGLRKHGVQKTRPTAVIVDGKQRRPVIYRAKPSKEAA